jgi:hypothetical protein
VALGGGSSARKTKVSSGMAGAVEKLKYWLQDFF